HPAVRTSIRESLAQLAMRSELDAPVRQAAGEMLAQDRWRGQEQAALLLTVLNEKSTASRLVALLESPRPEVGIASAWGLKQLALPETLPAIFDKARRQTELPQNLEAAPDIDRQTAHLFEAMGRMRYALADSLLREYIPKGISKVYKMGELSRCSA